MPLKRDQLERQITHAKAALEEWEKTLDGRGTKAAERKKEPKWRKLEAAHRQLKRRLGAVKAVEEREAEAATRKASKAEAE